MQPNREYEPTGGSMDGVQPPRPASPQSSSDNFIRPNQNLGRPATMEYTRPRSADGATPANTFAPAPEMSPSSSGKPVIKTAHKSRVPLVILILLILVAAGGAAYYFLVMKKAPAPVATPAATVTTVEKTTVEATPEGVDATVTSIDKKLNSVDDAKDFTPNDVSDDSLGL